MRKGFSLIELMVVIAIVGVLAAIASPLYQQYQGRAFFVNAIASTRDITVQLRKAYEANGAFPQNIVFNGITIPYQGTSVVNTAGIWKIQYVNNPGDAYGRMYMLYWNNLPYPGVPSGMVGIGIAIRDFNGVIKEACGNPANGVNYPPFNLLPSNCQCTSVDNWSRVGTPATGCP